MRVLVPLILYSLFFVACKTTEQGALPSTAESESQAVAQRSSGDKYYLPNQFDCYRPGVITNTSDGVSRPAQFPQFNSDYRCMVCNCVHESGREPHDAKVEIAKSVFTRIWDRHFPRNAGYENDECGIIYDRRQFSWTWGDRGFTRSGREINGKQDKRGQILSLDEPEVKACEVAMRDAYENHNNELGATHYVNAAIASPSWLGNCRRMNLPRNQRGVHTFCNGMTNEARPPRVPGAPIEASPIQTTIVRILRSFGFEI